MNGSRGHTAGDVRSAAAHGWLHSVAVGGVVAGVVGGVVLLAMRFFIGFGVLLAARYLTGSWRGYVSAGIRRELWVILKVPAHPLVGDRVFRSGFDARIVPLGVATLLVFWILLGLLFALAARGRSPAATIALGILFAIGAWLLDLRFINPSPATVVEFLPAGVAMACAFLWSEHRPPRTA